MDLALYWGKLFFTSEGVPWNLLGKFFVFPTNEQIQLLVDAKVTKFEREVWYHLVAP